MTHEFAENYDVIVVGAGHAGVEASLAAARMGCKTMLATIKKTYEILKTIANTCSIVITLPPWKK